MTFWKITDTRMNCLVSQDEMKDLGYDLADLMQDREKAREFLEILLKKGQEVLGLDIEKGIQNFYGAFLPDKSLLLSISCSDIEEELQGTGKIRKDVRLPLLPEIEDSGNPILSYQLLFASLDQTIRFCEIFGAGRAVQSRLYNHEGLYYLMLDFRNNEEGRQSAKTVVLAEEFGGVVERDAISELFLKEHEKCLIDEKAVETLLQLD